MTNHMPYLIVLNRRLAEVLADWPDGRRDVFAAAVRARQTAGGGFAGRAGGGDLYYTAFALRALAILGKLDDASAIVAGFLNEATTHNLIDAVSVLAARWTLADGPGPAVPDSMTHAARVEQFRCADGGYAKVPGSSTSSTYHSFLAALVYDLLAIPQPDWPGLARFVFGRVRDDGGFAELAPVRQSSVNPTAAGAAIVAAAELDAAASVDTEAAGCVYDGVAAFLLAAQRDDGGWPASPRTPASDLLSTFTALLTLVDLGRLDDARLPAAVEFAAACEVRPGLFGATPGDSDGDVEYIFYGLGCSAILS